MPASLSADVVALPAGRLLSEVVIAIGLSVGDHVAIPAKKTKVVAAGTGEARQNSLRMKGSSVMWPGG